MELFYREYGSGQPFIILHGVLGISDNWVSFGRRMADQGYKVYILDQRNHGKSPHHYSFNYYGLVEDLNDFIEQHQIEDPVILGHSMGGKVAIRYTLENTSSVDKLIVVDTSLRTYVRFNYHLQLIDAMLAVDFNKADTRAKVEEQLREKIKVERLIQFLMKNLFWKEKTRLGWRSNLQAISENLDSMYDGVFYSTKYHNPALFVRGGQSDYVLDDDIPAIHENFPNAEIATIDEGTHWVHADAPEEFFEIVLEFIKKS